jgi:hypothetical protein
MQSPEDGIEWHLNITNPGSYEVLITYGTSPEWKSFPYILKSGEEIIKEYTVITKGWFDYHTLKIGQFNFPEPGKKVIHFHPDSKLANQLMYFKSIELKPIRIN